MNELCLRSSFVVALSGVGVVKEGGGERTGVCVSVYSSLEWTIRPPPRVSICGTLLSQPAKPELRRGYEDREKDNTRAVTSSASVLS